MRDFKMVGNVVAVCVGCAGDDRYFTRPKDVSFGAQCSYSSTHDWWSKFRCMAMVELARMTVPLLVGEKDGRVDCTTFAREVSSVSVFVSFFFCLSFRWV